MVENLHLLANAVGARVLNASRETRCHIQNMLSYEVAGAEHMPGFRRNGGWDGRVSMFDFKTGTFPAGFFPEVCNEMINLGHDVTIRKVEPPAPAGPDIGTVDPLGFGFAERYDYQLQTVRELINRKRMVAMIATGGGKSNIAVLTHLTLGLPLLFLTTRGLLMYQMKENFERAGFNPGVMGNGEWSPRKGLNVAMVQTLTERLADPDDKWSEERKTSHLKNRQITLAILNHMQVVIGEEAHESGGSGYYEILNHCRNAHYRLALTATPFMRDDAESNMRLQASFGSIGIRVTEQTLIERGILAKPYFKFMDSAPHPYVKSGTGWPTCYEKGIVDNLDRNLQVAAEVSRAAKHGLPALVLIQRPRHGEILARMLSEAGISNALIHGEHDQAVRKEALNDLRTRRVKAVIGSTILDVGVDVPSVGFVAIAGGGKAEVAHRQRIGRGLREKKSGPNVTFIADFNDIFNRHLRNHSSKRMSMIEETPGFAENIIEKTGDFPYHFFK